MLIDLKKKIELIKTYIPEVYKLWAINIVYKKFNLLTDNNLNEIIENLRENFTELYSNYSNTVASIIIDINNIVKTFPEDKKYLTGLVMDAVVMVDKFDEVELDLSNYNRNPELYHLLPDLCQPIPVKYFMAFCAEIIAETSSVGDTDYDKFKYALDISSALAKNMSNTASKAIYDELLKYINRRLN